jgi:hypothetical protein
MVAPACPAATFSLSRLHDLFVSFVIGTTVKFPQNGLTDIRKDNILVSDQNLVEFARWYPWKHTTQLQVKVPKKAQMTPRKMKILLFIRSLPNLRET